jgi:rhamnose utilization protein RhaD (predicted bifunctional aldolase and dehydrogenase)
VAATLDEPELLRYRSNLLGSDLRITNFAGGNTSSKVVELDPLTGEPGGSAVGEGLGRRPGQHQARRLRHALPGKAAGAGAQCTKAWTFEDEMAEMYPLCAFRNNPVAASIDTPLHGFLPFPHVDHLHPDWGSRWRPAPTASRRWKSSIASLATAGVAAVAAARALNWR